MDVISVARRLIASTIEALRPTPVLDWAVEPGHDGQWTLVAEHASGAWSPDDWQCHGAYGSFAEAWAEGLERFGTSHGPRFRTMMVELAAG